MFVQQYKLHSFSTRDLFYLTNSLNCRDFSNWFREYRNIWSMTVSVYMWKVIFNLKVLIFFTHSPYLTTIGNCLRYIWTYLYLTYRTPDLEGLIQKLSNMASVCSQVQLTLTNILNVRLAPNDKKEISIEFFLLKNCYKRRKVSYFVLAWRVSHFVLGWKVS